MIHSILFHMGKHLRPFFPNGEPGKSHIQEKRLVHGQGRPIGPQFAHQIHIALQEYALPLQSFLQLPYVRTGYHPAVQSDCLSPSQTLLQEFHIIGNPLFLLEQLKLTVLNLLCSLYVIAPISPENGTVHCDNNRSCRTGKSGDPFPGPVIIRNILIQMGICTWYHISVDAFRLHTLPQCPQFFIYRHMKDSLLYLRIHFTSIASILSPISHFGEYHAEAARRKRIKALSNRT